MDVTPKEPHVIHLPMINYLKANRGTSLDSLAKELQKSKEYILGVVETDSYGRYKVIDGVITLNNLGTKLCVVCGENSDYNSASIRLPEGILGANKVLDISLSEGIKGHMKCYESIDVIFREKNSIHCIDCNSFRGEEIDGNEWLEKCWQLGYHETGYKGIMAYNSMCNHFHPDQHMRDESYISDAERRKTWNDIKLNVAQRTLEGYRNLIKILEQNKLIIDASRK